MHSQPDFGEPRCVIVFFRPRLTMGEMTAWPKDRLFAFGEPYSSVGGEWTGFYDWIRNAAGVLLGVRYWPFESTEFVISRAAQLGYVQTSERRYVEIFFSNERCISKELSKDQEFLYDPVFVSPSGECALAFSTEGLSEADYRSISAAEAEWVPI
jgi:hypothetical protein